MRAVAVRRPRRPTIATLVAITSLGTLMVSSFLVGYSLAAFSDTTNNTGNYF